MKVSRVLSNVGLGLLITLNTVAMASCFGMLWHEQKQSCIARWADSGMAAKWKDGAGCLVEHKPGQWMSEQFLKGHSK